MNFADEERAILYRDRGGAAGGRFEVDANGLSSRRIENAASVMEKVAIDGPVAQLVTCDDLAWALHPAG
jgi:hypothetical protein